MIDEDETDEKIGVLSIIRTFIVSNSEKTKNILVPDNGDNLNYSLIYPKNQKSSVNFPRVGRQFLIVLQFPHKTETVETVVSVPMERVSFVERKNYFFLEVLLLEERSNVLSFLNFLKLSQSILILLLFGFG